MIIPQIFQFVGQIIRLLCSLQNVLQMTPLALQRHFASVVGLDKLVQRRVVSEEVLAGTEIPGGGGGGRLYLTLHRHHQNDSCIKMGSDESRFNVSLIVRDKVTRQRPHATTYKKRRQAKAKSNRGPSAYQPNALRWATPADMDERTIQRPTCSRGLILDSSRSVSRKGYNY